MVRSPRIDSAVTEPPVSARTAVISPDGSAWASEPTVVPRLRMVGWATSASAWPSSGCARRASASCSTPGVAGQGADPHPVDAGVDRVEVGDPVDVHQVGRFGQTHRQHRDQRLAAGQHLAVVTRPRRAPRRPRRRMSVRARRRAPVSLLRSCPIGPDPAPRRRCADRARGASGSIVADGPAPEDEKHRETDSHHGIGVHGRCVDAQPVGSVAGPARTATTAATRT